MLASTLMEMFNIQVASNTPQTPQEIMQAYVQQLKGRADAIHSAGEKIIQLENGSSTTELLQNLEHKNSQSYNVPYTLVNLQIQAKCITPPCFFPFFFNVRKFFDQIPSEVAVQFSFEVEDIARGLTGMAVIMNCPKVVLKTLRKIISLACPKVHLFSPLYSDFLQLCIQSQLYGLAIEFLQEREVYEITERMNLFSEDYMRFFYYAGICHLAMKDYRHALEDFITCITTPANVLSQVAINAIKKAKLISLLAFGDKFELPKYTPSVVLRFFHEDMTPYDQIVDKFSNDDINELAQVILNGEEVLKQDNNYGIAKSLLTEWKLNRIRNISRSYLTLSLPAITEALNSQESPEVMEKTIFKMICDERVIASIDGTTGVINFEEESIFQRNFEKNKAKFAGTMEESMENILKISNYLRENQKEILGSSEYIQRMTSSGGGRLGGGIGGGAGVWGIASTMEFS